MSHRIKVIQTRQHYADEISTQVLLLNESEAIEFIDLELLRQDTARFYQLSPKAIAELSYLSGWTDQRNCEQQIREELAALRRKHEKRRNLLMKQRKARQAAARTAKNAESII